MGRIGPGPIIITTTLPTAAPLDAISVSRVYKAMRTLHPDEFMTRKLLANSAPPNERGCRCWLRSTRGGYGRLWNGVRVEDVHRISYRLHVGEIPEGMDVLHRCDTPSCWEPSHLFLGTQADNNADRAAKGRNGKTGAPPGTPSHQRGERHKRSKLTKEQVKQVLALRRGPRRNLSAVARQLGVSDSLIRGILAGKNWAWLRTP